MGGQPDTPAPVFPLQLKLLWSKPAKLLHAPPSLQVWASSACASLWRSTKCAKPLHGLSERQAAECLPETAPVAIAKTHLDRCTGLTASTPIMGAAYILGIFCTIYNLHYRRIACTPYIYTHFACRKIESYGRILYYLQILQNTELSIIAQPAPAKVHYILFQDHIRSARQYANPTRSLDQII